MLGANGGLGSAIAGLLAERGSRLALTFRSSPSGLDAVTARPGVVARSYQLDLADAAACAAVVTSVVADFGAIHTVVYAAGPHVPMLHLSRVPPAQFEEQLRGDAAAFFNLISPALAHLRGSHAARGNIPLRRFGSARDVAEAVCFLASDRAGFITGQKLEVDGGYGV